MTMPLTLNSMNPPAIVRRRDEGTAGPIRLATTKPQMPEIITTPSHHSELENAQRRTELEARFDSCSRFVDQLNELLSDYTNWDEGCLAPKFRAQNVVVDLLDGVAGHMVIPEGSLYPDGEGGLRIEWRSPDSPDLERYVLLNVHPSDEQKDYIYYQEGHRRGDVQGEITSDLLARRLQWLSGAVK